MKLVSFLFFILSSNCSSILSTPSDKSLPEETSFVKDTFIYPINSWQYFLQHLPTVKGPIVDYRGNAIADQKKHVAVINYDISTSDLQQCADALMRLRAEYLFSQKRYSEIGFHFTSGDYYSWEDYCKGKRPELKRDKIYFIKSIPSDKTHPSLRRYLDIVYTYASTISLNKELKPGNSFDIGTIIIHPGSPGHCCIITDKLINEEGEILYKLVEGYTPAQSIYVLSNLYNKISPWYKLNEGAIRTSSYTFNRYNLKKFE